jgi:hypothetical protein
VIKRFTIIEDANDSWTYLYDSRYRELRLVCKKAGENATIKIQEFDMKTVDDALIILSALKNELWPKDKLV